MRPTPTGISLPAIVKLSGTRNSRLRVCIPQDEDRKTVENETPNYAKSIKVRQERNVAAAYQDHQQLKHHHEINDPV